MREKSQPLYINKDVFVGFVLTHYVSAGLVYLCKMALGHMMYPRCPCTLWQICQKWSKIQFGLKLYLPSSAQIYLKHPKIDKPRLAQQALVSPMVWTRSRILLTIQFSDFFRNFPISDFPIFDREASQAVLKV